MVKAKQSAAWDHTAALLTQVANIHRDTKKHDKPFTVEQLHPYLKATEEKPMTIGEAAAFYGNRAIN